jgi:alpha-tubulin suppressor-like RCC1 family protein
MNDSEIELYYNGHDAKKIKMIWNRDNYSYDMVLLKIDGSVWHGSVVSALRRYNELNDIADIDLTANCLAALGENGVLWICGIDDCNNINGKPQKIYTDNKILKISCQSYQIALLDENGKVWTVDIDRKEKKYSAPQIASITNIIDIVSGGKYSMALDKDGKIYSWGEAYQHDSGLIGITEASPNQPDVTQNIQFASEPIYINSNIGLQDNAAKIDTTGRTSIVVDKENNLYILGVLYKWPEGIYLSIPSETTAQKIGKIGANSKVFALSAGVLEIEENGDLRLWR